MRECAERCNGCLVEAAEAIRELADAARDVVRSPDYGRVKMASDLALACGEVGASIKRFQRQLEALPGVDLRKAPPPAPIAIELPVPAGVAVAGRGHLLGEDNLQGKRPRGYVLDGIVHRNIKTWTNVYLGLCKLLASRSPEKYGSLPESDVMCTSRGRQLFACDESRVQCPAKVGGLWADTYGTTKVLCKRMRQLLHEFGMQENELTVFFKGEEDQMPKDAAGDPKRTVSAGRPWALSGCENPYRQKTVYNAIFDRMVSHAVSVDELQQWFMQKTGKAEPQAKASVDVVTSPVRDVSCMSRKTGNVCGNYSAQGHLYYVETRDDGTLEVFKRIPSLPPHRRRA